MIRALVTRPLADAGRTADALAARGVSALVEPMLRIELLPAPALDLAGVQALLFTSKNGVRAFAAASPERGLPAFAAGDATAQEARAAGFRRVESAAGGVQALVRLAAARCEASAGALLHGAGDIVAGNLAGRLAEAGFTVRREALYRARAADAFSPALVGELVAGHFRLALFFSPRTAAVFARLAPRSGVGDACRAVYACVLSEAVGRALEGVAWRGIRAAARPDHEAMMAEVDLVLETIGAAGEPPEGRR